MPLSDSELLQYVCWNALDLRAWHLPNAAASCVFFNALAVQLQDRRLALNFLVACLASPRCRPCRAPCALLYSFLLFGETCSDPNSSACLGPARVGATVSVLVRSSESLWSVAAEQLWGRLRGSDFLWTLDSCLPLD